MNLFVKMSDMWLCLSLHGMCILWTILTILKIVVYLVLLFVTMTIICYDVLFVCNTHRQRSSTAPLLHPANAQALIHVLPFQWRFSPYHR